KYQLRAGNRSRKTKFLPRAPPRPLRLCVNSTNPILPLHRAEDLQAEAFVRSQDAAVRFEFVERGHGHAEIDGGKWASANNAVFPAARVADFFNLLVGAGIKGNEPFIAAEVTFAFLFPFEPFVAEQNANRASAAGAEAIEDHASIGFGKMVVDNLGGIGGLRSKLRLDTELHSAGHARVAL